MEIDDTKDQVFITRKERDFTQIANETLRETVENKENAKLGKGFEREIKVSQEMYAFFMANGQPGMEALSVYMHLQFTAIKQNTDQVWATNGYIKKGVSFGEDKVKRAKAFLKKHGLIEYVHDTDKKGRRVKTYISLIYLHNMNTGATEERTEKPAQKSTGVISTPLDIHTTGSERQVLRNNKRTALKKKVKGGETPPFIKHEHWELFDVSTKKILLWFIKNGLEDKARMKWETFLEAKGEKLVGSRRGAVTIVNTDFGDILNSQYESELSQQRTQIMLAETRSNRAGLKVV